MSCYQINNDATSHYSATRTCQSSGGELIDIDSNVEQAFISTKVDKYTWIGKYISKFQNEGEEFVFRLFVSACSTVSKIMREN